MFRSLAAELRERPYIPKGYALPYAEVALLRTPARQAVTEPVVQPGDVAGGDVQVEPLDRRPEPLCQRQQRVELGVQLVDDGHGRDVVRSQQDAPSA